MYRESISEEVMFLKILLGISPKEKFNGESAINDGGTDKRFFNFFLKP